MADFDFTEAAQNVMGMGIMTYGLHALSSPKIRGPRAIIVLHSSMVLDATISSVPRKTVEPILVSPILNIT